MNPIHLPAGLWATGSVMRTSFVLPAPTRMTAVMLDSPRTTLRAGQYDGTKKASQSETLPRDCSQTTSTVHLLSPPLPTGTRQQRVRTVISREGTYRETQARIMGKKAARGLLCSRFLLLLLGWAWLPIQAYCRNCAATRKKRNTSVCRRQVSLACTSICSATSRAHVL